MIPPMQIDKTLENGILTLKVAGRLDTNTSADLEAALALDGVGGVVFDFSELEYISSAGLRILIAAQKAMSANGGSMAIVGPNEAVRSVFEITGCSEIFTIS